MPLLQRLSFSDIIAMMDLQEIQNPVKDYLLETDQILQNYLTRSAVELINRINQGAPISKGKKIRSTLLFLLSGLEDTLSPDLPEIAASIEMYHLSSLVHDDIVDNSEYRRGEKTLHAKFGNHLSVLWGDFLFISALNLFEQTGNNHLLKSFLRTAKLMVEGQLLEVENAFNFKMDLNTYYRIIEKKTCALFANIGEIVAISRNNSSQSEQDFYNFGLNFGFMFQIRDDLLDIFSENSGKDRFRDLKEGKITLPVILYLQKEDQDKVDSLSQVEPQELLKRLQMYEIKDLSLQKIDEFHKKCVEFLEVFPDSVYKSALMQLLNFVKYRDY
jgi:octaprenyl-diphosphate synthase